MFYLSVAREVLVKVKEHAEAIADRRVIGLLLGRMEGKALIVQDAIPTEFRRQEESVKIPPESIAKVANLIADNKVEGNIVGWYHTHPGYGAFMSEVDVRTQLTLQQFSPYIVSMVIDPNTDDVKFFTLEDKSGKIAEVKGDRLHIFEKGQSPIPESFKKPGMEEFTDSYAPSPSAPSRQEVRPPAPLTKRQIYALVSTIILIGAVVGSLILMITLKGGVAPQASLPVIDHTPVSKGVVGKEITLRAKVSGGFEGIRNVTVGYEWSAFSESVTGEMASVEQGWKTSLMLLVAAGGDEYAYTIPPDEVMGDIDYYIRAVDQLGHAAATPIYTITVADFRLKASTDEIKSFLGETQSTTITVESIGDFQSPVRLSLSDTPYGIQAELKPDTLTPPKNGFATATLTVTPSASSGTFRGKFELKIFGKSEKAEHQAKISVTVPNYDIAVSPSSLTIAKGETGTVTLKLTPTGGFDREIKFSITGLPKEIDWDIGLKDRKLALGQETVLTLKISATGKVQAGTYILTFGSEGGGVKTQSSITLTVR